MNKTIYLREEEGPLWEKARELANDKLSPVIVEALKVFVAQKEAEQKIAMGFQRIVISYEDADDLSLPKKKAFVGRWIFSPENPFVLPWEFRDQDNSFAVAVTPKGAAVFYSWQGPVGSTPTARFRVFGSFEQAAADDACNAAAREAMNKIGVPIEELDI